MRMDDTICWVLERLAEADDVDDDLLRRNVEALLPAVPSEGPDPVPSKLRAKLALRMLSRATEPGVVYDANMHAQLESLALLSRGAMGPRVDRTAVAPPSDLLLAAVTEMVVSVLRDYPDCSPQDAKPYVDFYFHPEIQAADPTFAQRHNELLAAALHPDRRPAVVAKYTPEALRQQLATYVVRAKQGLGRGMLMTVWTLIAEDKFNPYAEQQPLQRSSRPPPAPVAASPLRSPGAFLVAASPGAPAGAAASPGRTGLPPAPQRSGPSRVPVARQLEEDLGALRQAGGPDPLPDALAQARVAAASGVAAVAGRHVPRLVSWGSPEEAVQHPIPELPGFEAREHGALPGQDGLSQQLLDAAAQAQEGRSPGVQGMRRKRKDWEDEEVAALKAYCFRFGSGSWAAMKQEDEENGGDILHDRTKVDLKDKWRNMLKNKQVTEEELKLVRAAERRYRQGQVQQGKKLPGRPRRKSIDGTDDEIEDADQEAGEEQEDKGEESPGMQSDGGRGVKTRRAAAQEQQAAAALLGQPAAKGGRKAARGHKRPSGKAADPRRRKKASGDVQHAASDDGHQDESEEERAAEDDA